MRYAKLTIVEERMVQSADGNFRFIEAKETGETLIFPSVDKAHQFAFMITDDCFRDIGRGVFARRKAVVSAIEAFGADEGDADDPIRGCPTMPNRVANALWRAGFERFRDLTAITKSEARKIRCIGKASMADILSEMSMRGLSFKEE